MSQRWIFICFNDRNEATTFCELRRLVCRWKDQRTVKWVLERIWSHNLSSTISINKYVILAPIWDDFSSFLTSDLQIPGILALIPQRQFTCRRVWTKNFKTDGNCSIVEDIADSECALSPLRFWCVQILSGFRIDLGIAGNAQCSSWSFN